MDEIYEEEGSTQDNIDAMLFQSVTGSHKQEPETAQSVSSSKHLAISRSPYFGDAKLKELNQYDAASEKTGGRTPDSVGKGLDDLKAQSVSSDQGQNVLGVADGARISQLRGRASARGEADRLVTDKD